MSALTKSLFAAALQSGLSCCLLKIPPGIFPAPKLKNQQALNRKRSDLRFYDTRERLVLGGEVKMPGTVEGRNPYNSALIEDSSQKASGAGAEFFFTWNVNTFVLFDAKKWHLPLMERRVREFDLGLDLEHPEDVSRPEAEKGVQAFLAEFLGQFLK